MSQPSNSRPLDGKIALVTGASRGIGAAIARGLAADGAAAAVHYNGSAGPAAAVVEAIVAQGGQAFAVQADLASPDGPAQLFAALDRELAGRFGSTAFDILVNNAGVAPFGGLGELDAASFDRLNAINIRSVYFVTEAAAQRLREGGRVINLSSAATRVGVPAALAYSASKGWVDSFTRSLASTLAARGITVNAIAPGVIETDMSAPMLADGGAGILTKQALQRIGQPDDIAHLVRALAGPGGGWTTGQTIDASGGSGIAF
jgi:NAD(P)-dependent dehydrogenase (short-subunit alcohol dehydrogenase family)